MQKRMNEYAQLISQTQAFAITRVSYGKVPEWVNPWLLANLWDAIVCYAHLEIHIDRGDVLMNLSCAGTSLKCSAEDQRHSGGKLTLIFSAESGPSQEPVTSFETLNGIWVSIDVFVNQPMVLASLMYLNRKFNHRGPRVFVPIERRLTVSASKSVC